VEGTAAGLKSLQDFQISGMLIGHFNLMKQIETSVLPKVADECFLENCVYMYLQLYIVQYIDKL
jgi:hypothetical protein